MQTKEGVFIVIEGSDGSGKSTQFELLTKRLENAGYDIVALKFPQYNEPSSYFVKQYLAGAYGSTDEVGPYTASLFYALDRFAAAEKIRSALAQGKIVVVDRYTGSNMAHQGTKFHHADQRRGYFIWLDNLEFEMLRIPRPDANFVLNVPAEFTQVLLKKTEKKQDIHEADIEHLKRSVEVFNDLSQLFPKDFVRIDCVRGGELLPIDIVSNLIWEKVFPLLPTEPERKRVAPATADAAASISEENPYIQKTRTGLSITAAGREFLEKVVTDTSGDIYAFKDKFNATMIAAAIVRSSKRTQDLRSVILDAFTKNYENDDILRRAMMKNDPSMKRLVGLNLVVEHCSALVATFVGQNRRATYVSPPLSIERFDKKDEHGQFKYYTPDYFKGSIAQEYRERMDEIFENYANLVTHLTHYLRERTSMPKTEQTDTWKRTTRAQARQVAAAVLPVAAKTSVSIFTSARTLETTIMHLLHDPLPESGLTGLHLLKEAQKIAPELFSDIDTNAKNSPKTVVAQLSEEYLPDNYAPSFTEPVSLSDFWPRNELDMVADMLFEQSNLSLAELKRTIDKWPYQRKADVITAYLHEVGSQRPRAGHALEKIHYSWDMVSDFTTFRDMLLYQRVENLNWQQLTPRNGYEVPTIIEDAGLADIFEASFDISLELHSKLQEAGFLIESQYATLMGHRLRWTATYNAREIYRMLKTRVENPNSGKLLSRMHELLAEVHPMIADSLYASDKE